MLTYFSIEADADILSIVLVPFKISSTNAKTGILPLMNLITFLNFLSQK